VGDPQPGPAKPKGPGSPSSSGSPSEDANGLGAAVETQAEFEPAWVISGAKQPVYLDTSSPETMVLLWFFPMKDEKVKPGHCQDARSPFTKSSLPDCSCRFSLEKLL
jgi:hypothetical protein